MDPFFFFFFFSSCKLLLGPLVGMFITHLTLAWMALWPSDPSRIRAVFLRSRWYKSPSSSSFFPPAFLTSHRRSLTAPVIILFLFPVFTWFVPVNIILSFWVSFLTITPTLNILLLSALSRLLILYQARIRISLQNPAISVRIPRRYSRLWLGRFLKLSLINGLSSVRDRLLFSVSLRLPLLYIITSPKKAPLKGRIISETSYFLIFTNWS